MSTTTEPTAEKPKKEKKEKKREKKRERSPSSDPDEAAKAARKAAKKAKKEAAAVAAAAVSAAADDMDAPPTPTKCMSVDDLAALAKRSADDAKAATKKAELDAFFKHGDVAVETSDWLTKHEVAIHDSGGIVKVCMGFDDAPFDGPMLSLLKQQGFPSPSAVQGAGWPIARAGRDLLAVTKTGSGKTLGFLLPALTACAANKANAKGKPTALVMSPTRELALQIASEAAKFGRPVGCRSVAVYGGAPKWAQASQLQRGVELVVATPGRMLDMLVRRRTSSRCLTTHARDARDV